MIELRHQDCMEYMRGLPDKAFDLAIVDPPYGMRQMGAQSGGNADMRHLKYYNGAIDKWDKAPAPEYFTEIRRVSVNQIIWGGNYFPLPPTRCVIVWDKVQGMQGYFSQVEIAWTSYGLPATLFRFNNVTNDKIHPTQKPVALYRWLLKNYAKPGQRILDTHLGSGSIAIACDLEGYDLVGCEIDADYIAGARKRLADHQAQPRLFDMPKPTTEQLRLDTDEPKEDAEAA